jgi:hypothetical protein
MGRPKKPAKPEAERDEKPWTQQVQCPTHGTSHGSHGVLAENGGDRVQRMLRHAPRLSEDEE